MTGIDSLFQWMQSFALEAGAVAVKQQKGVREERKETDDEGYAHSRGGMAKTAIDELIQEMFLEQVSAHFPTLSFRINAEENTPRLKQFPNREAAYTLHLDPIDGTLGYIRQGKDFAVGMAISDRDNNFTHTVIFAPLHDRLFVASPAGAQIFDGAMRPVNGASMRPPRPVFYEKRLLSDAGLAAMRELGLEKESLPSSHLDIVYAALGRAAVFLYGGSNVHDGMIPLAFARAYGLIPYSKNGTAITGAHLREAPIDGVLRYRRIPSLCFFSCDDAMQKKIFVLLADSKNLHPEYLARFHADDV